MPLTITDFVEQVDGLTVEDISEKNRERINDALADLTGGPGGSASPINNNAILVSKNLGGRAGYNTIGDALSGSNGVNSPQTVSSGDTIFVESGTYTEDVVVDKQGLTVQGFSDPGGVNPATLDGRMEVSASGATVENLRFAPSTEYDIDAGVDPNVLLVSADGVTVRNNLLEGLRADATGGSNSGSLNGIQVFDASNSPVGGVLVENNTVRDMVTDGNASAGWPNYGGAAAIKVQGTLDGVDVIGNTVEDVYSAGWTWGIVMTHTNTVSFSNVSPKDVTVKQNTVRKLNTVGSQFNPSPDGSATYTGNGFGIDGNSDADEATVMNNNFVQVPNGVQSKDPNNTLDVTNNWWGDSTGPSTGVVPSSVSQITDADTGEAADGNGTGISTTGQNVDVRFDPWLNNSV